MNIYASHYVGTVLFWHKNDVFNAKRLKKSVRSRPRMACININSFCYSLLYWQKYKKAKVWKVKFLPL